MRSGFTTGSCAAAAVKAALLVACGQVAPKHVQVTSPQGQSITVPIEKVVALDDNRFHAVVLKDAGDDPDITNGIEICATIEVLSSSDFILEAGNGVGTVTKPGLSIPVGQPAINPGPQTMIRQAVRDVLPPEQGIRITLSIPEGERLAQRTLNPTLGILGGLSIIGTTGIVHPMSEEAFKNSLTPQLGLVRAAGYDTVVLAPGKIGQTIAIEQYGLPAAAVIQTSNFIGHLLEQAVVYDMRRVLLFGHLGKLVKVAAGIFHTHNRMADARLETLAAYLAAHGAKQDTVCAILNCTTTEAALPIIAAAGYDHIYDYLAKRASLRAERYVFQDLAVGTAIVTLQGQLLGIDHTGKEIGGSLGWNITSL